MKPEHAEDTSVHELNAGRPVLAILTIDDDVLMFRGNRANFADLIRTGREMGFIVYVLTVKDLKLKRSKLKGYTYHEKSDTWSRQQFPFPDIIYNRIPQREDEMQPLVRKKLAACLRNPRLKLFNPTFFNKWQLFEWLRSSSSTKPFIPTTRRLLTSAGLHRLMRKHSYLYLKPVSGKAGKGIMTVKLLPEKQLPFRLKIQEDKKSITYNCASLPKLWNRIVKQCGNAPYIVQQGIRLAQFNDRKFDLRALVQKNQRGQWELTGIGARVAGSFSITTHVPRGGSIEDPFKLLNSYFGQEQAHIIQTKVKNAVLAIARQIERGSGQALGEMSLDLGVDRNGKIWFFEANAKPMKFDETHIRRKSLEQIFHYSQYLYNKKTAKAGGA
jgi:hypothetical protein